MLVGGKKKAGAPGRAAKPGVSIVVALVDRRVEGFGRTRLVVVPDSSDHSRAAVLREHVEPTATVATDAWVAWEKATKAVGDAHDRTSVPKSGKNAHCML